MDPVPPYHEAYHDLKVDRGYGHDSDAKFNAAHGLRPELPPDKALAEMTARGDFDKGMDRMIQQFSAELAKTLEENKDDYESTHQLLKEMLAQPPSRPAMNEAVPTAGHVSTAVPSLSEAYEPVYRTSVPLYEEWVRLATSGP